MLITREQVSALPFTLRRVMTNPLRPTEIRLRDPSYREVVGEVPAPPSGAVAISWSPPSAQATWIIPHNIGRHPLVAVRDPDGEVLFTTVTHLDQNTCMIEFMVPVLGTADLR
jgi:hypothetical protein